MLQQCVRRSCRRWLRGGRCSIGALADRHRHLSGNTTTKTTTTTTTAAASTSNGRQSVPTPAIVPLVCVNKFRDRWCSSIDGTLVNERVRVCGRLSSVRVLGPMLFVVLTDEQGAVQAIYRRSLAHSEDAYERVKRLSPNTVCSLKGVVHARPERDGGGVEIHIEELQVLSNVGVTRWPIDASSGEDALLRERHLQLRGTELQRRLRLRSRLLQHLREGLHQAAFVEVETPTLLRSSPEGAREFLVPARHDHHHQQEQQKQEYYALSQSPQQYKQMLMCGGFERYFQMARCFRDEDGRADRQPEFTQLDLEMAFVTRDDVLNVIERLLWRVQEREPELGLCLPGANNGSLPRLTYDEAMALYGSDKPDLRYDMQLQTLAPNLVVLNANKLGLLSSRQRRELQHEFGASALRWVRVERLSPKYKQVLPEHRKLEKSPACDGDVLVVARDLPRQEALQTLGRVRTRCAELLRQQSLLDFAPHRWTWVVDFPMFERASNGRLQAVHHPFSAVHDTQLQQLLDAQVDVDEEALLRLRSQTYDLVVDGVELGGGSVRIHEAGVQRHVLKLLHVDEASFPTLLRALSHAAPPHAGVALGLDRMLALFTDANSLRDVIAFPKSAGGRDLFLPSPSPLLSFADTDATDATDAPEPEPEPEPTSAV